jgi:prophage regulatory protein
LSEEKRELPHELFVPPVKLLTLQMVLDMTTLSKSTWLKGVREGRYPQPVRLSVRRLAWKSADIIKVMEGGMERECYDRNRE